MSQNGETLTASNTEQRSDELKDGTNISVNVKIAPPPTGCETYYNSIISPEAVKFVSLLCNEFQEDVNSILKTRISVKEELDRTESLPKFPEHSECRNNEWRVAPVPARLQCRHIDLGDVSPSNTGHFIAALNSKAQGVQTDFDDGHCPSWQNQINGLHNVYSAVHNKLPEVPEISKAPLLMLRPRAWNMVEYNMKVNDQEVPGPLFDFGFLMYYCGRALLDSDSGPFFYLSKLEGSNEAALWNRIFHWTEEQLDLPQTCIKACVLIENVLAAFQMEEILYELRDRSIGLNCGLWDYSASFINKFGHRNDFVLPDRNKYVSMDQHFLASYRDLVIKTCHNRGAHATGGMAALLLPALEQKQQYQEILEKVRSGKKKEIEAGVDGFLVYDLGLVEPMQQLFKDQNTGENQHHITRNDLMVEPTDLLKMPGGSVTLSGLKHNIKVGIYFVEAWLRGQGHFFLESAVEDSATAEISRSQVWQWMRHKTTLEENGNTVTLEMVRKLAADVVADASNSLDCFQNVPCRNLNLASDMFLDILSKPEFVEFVTTYLSSRIYQPSS